MRGLNVRGLNSVGGDHLNIAIVGSVVEEKDVMNYLGSSVAGNKMQLGFIRSFYRHLGNVQVISVEPHQQWRGNGKIVVGGKNETIDNKIPIKKVFFINLIVIKQITIWLSIFINLMVWGLKNYNDKEKVIIVYNTVSYFAIPVLLISTILNCKSLAIVADLPIKKSNKSLISRLEDYLEVKLIKKFNLLISLTKNIVQDFGNKQPYLVIEAGIEEKIFQSIAVVKRKSKIFDIVFSGSLNELSGIELAIKAINKIEDKTIRLNIYGKGIMEKFVRESAENNPNIKFHGNVSNAEIMLIQRKADLLIAPREPDDYTTKYTFPSKLVEYMATGVPVICNKLQGIPNEYYNHIIALDSAAEHSWAKEIESVRNDKKGYYKNKANQAKAFIFENKTWEKIDIELVNFLKENIHA